MVLTSGVRITTSSDTIKGIFDLEKVKDYLSKEGELRIPSEITFTDLFMPLKNGAEMQQFITIKGHTADVELSLSWSYNDLVILKGFIDSFLKTNKYVQDYHDRIEVEEDEI